MSSSMRLRIPAGFTTNALRLAFSALAVAALVTGYIGLAKYVPSRPAFGHGPLDIIYYDFQLFVLGSDPVGEGGPYPLALDFARFAAPAVTLFAVAEAVRILFTAQFARLRLRFLRGHVIVAGDGLIAETLADRVTAGARRPVVLVTGGIRGIPTGRLRMVVGDFRDARLLESLSVTRATTLYACGHDSMANTVIALNAAKLIGERVESPRRILRPRKYRLGAYVRVSDPDLCAALAARRLGLADDSGLRLHFFCPDELGAETLISREIRSSANEPPEHVVIVGMTGFGRTLLLEIVRWWRSCGRNSGRRPLMTLVDPQASTCLRQVIRRYKFASKFCRFEVHDGDLAGYLHAAGSPINADRIYIALADDLSALKLALTIGGLSRNRSQRIVVRQERFAALGLGFGDGSVGRLVDDLKGTLRVFGVADTVCDTRVIDQDLTERLARSVHERYVLNRAVLGDTPETNVAMVPWALLPEDLRSANRRQVDDIGRKLRVLDCALTIRDDPQTEFEFTPDEVDTLAIMEHRRWVDERLERGWTYGPIRDNLLRRHPDLREWREISEEVREKDRAAVREIPCILEDAGFQILRKGIDDSASPAGNELSGGEMGSGQH